MNAATVILTAVLSSALTWLLAYLWFRARLQRQLEELRAELAEEVEARVRAGVLAAGNDLLPALRKEVSAGFLDAVRELPGGELTMTARDLTKAGANLFGEHLGRAFNPRGSR